jgi:hypothetical protein
VGFSNAAIAVVSVQNAHVENVQVRNCRGGIIVGNNAHVENCQVTGPAGGGNGFGSAQGCTFTDCIEEQCTTGFSVGDNCILTRCVAFNNTGDGINAGANAVITSCIAVSNSHGIFALQSSRYENNTANNNSQDGITPSSDSVVLNNICNYNTFRGINLGGPVFNTRIEGNHLGSNGLSGITIGAGATNNIVIRNSARRNGANTDPSNYTIVAGNDVGPIGNVATNTSPWANLR